MIQHHLIKENKKGACHPTCGCQEGTDPAYPCSIFTFLKRMKMIKKMLFPRTGQSKNFTNPRLHYSNSHNSRTQCSSLESTKDDPSTEFIPQGWNVNVPFISSEPRRPRPSFLIFLLTNVFVFCQEIRHPSSGNTLDFDELFIGVRSGPVFWRDEWWWLVVLLMDEKVS